MSRRSSSTTRRSITKRKTNGCRPRSPAPACSRRGLPAPTSSTGSSSSAGGRGASLVQALASSVEPRFIGNPRVSQPYVFQLASQRTQWLSARETLIAGNVANVNTPGYQATDLQPFSAVLDSTNVTMAATNSMHLTPAQQELTAARVVDTDSPDETLSGNSVQLEREMIKLGDVNREYSMSSNIKRALHQMMMSALK